MFIALLELCKRRMIAVEQDGPRADISIRLVEASQDSAARPENQIPQNDIDLEVVAA
jgi:chromatin segregation and condensation protein Rec8/ScpA/Scc1 (kleisin family)